MAYKRNLTCEELKINELKSLQKLRGALIFFCESTSTSPDTDIKVKFLKHNLILVRQIISEKI